jgi:hypothetical protein
LRKFLRTLGIVFWSVLSIDIVIGVLDWLGRWDWLAAFINAHPPLASFVRTPIVYLGLLILGFVFLLSEQRLKQPKLVCRLTNWRTIPDLHTTPMAALFESENKTPGWDERKIDWYSFMEVQVTNDSDTPTTISGLKTRAKTKRGWLRTEPVAITHFEDFDKFLMDVGLDVNLKGVHHTGERHRKVPSLIEKIKDVPLTRGIGHTGWLGFRLAQVSQKDVNGGQLVLDVCLVDSLGGRHELKSHKEDEEQWDKSFLIFKDKE